MNQGNATDYITKVEKVIDIWALKDKHIPYLYHKLN